VNTIGSYQCIVSTTESADLNNNNNNNNNNEDDDDVTGDDDIGDDVTLCESGYTFDSESNICVHNDECEK